MPEKKLIPANRKYKLPAGYTISKGNLARAEKEISADIKSTLNVFRAVSHPIRLRILRALRVNKLCVCVFVVLFKYKYSKLSYHLRLLKEARLIDSEKEGNLLIYHLTDFGKKILDDVGH